jgi:hypothetical protein
VIAYTVAGVMGGEWWVPNQTGHTIQRHNGSCTTGPVVWCVCVGWVCVCYEPEMQAVYHAD